MAKRKSWKTLFVCSHGALQRIPAAPPLHPGSWIVDPPSNFRPRWLPRARGLAQVRTCPRGQHSRSHRVTTRMTRTAYIPASGAGEPLCAGAQAQQVVTFPRDPVPSGVTSPTNSPFLKSMAQNVGKPARRWHVLTAVKRLFGELSGIGPLPRAQAVTIRRDLCASPSNSRSSASPGPTPSHRAAATAAGTGAPSINNSVGVRLALAAANDVQLTTWYAPLLMRLTSTEGSSQAGAAGSSDYYALLDAIGVKALLLALQSGCTDPATKDLRTLLLRATEATAIRAASPSNLTPQPSFFDGTPKLRCAMDHLLNAVLRADEKTAGLERRTLLAVLRHPALPPVQDLFSPVEQQAVSGMAVTDATGEALLDLLLRLPEVRPGLLASFLGSHICQSVVPYSFVNAMYQRRMADTTVNRSTRAMLLAYLGVVLPEAQRRAENQHQLNAGALLDAIMKNRNESAEEAGLALRVVLGLERPLLSVPDLCAMTRDWSATDPDVLCRAWELYINDGQQVLQPLLELLVAPAVHDKTVAEHAFVVAHHAEAQTGFLRAYTPEPVLKQLLEVQTCIPDNAAVCSAALVCLGLGVKNQQRVADLLLDEAAAPVVKILLRAAQTEAVPLLAHALALGRPAGAERLLDHLIRDESTFAQQVVAHACRSDSAHKLLQRVVQARQGSGLLSAFCRFVAHAAEGATQASSAGTTNVATHACAMLGLLEDHLLKPSVLPADVTEKLELELQQQAGVLVRCIGAPDPAVRGSAIRLLQRLLDLTHEATQAMLASRGAGAGDGDDLDDGRGGGVGAIRAVFFSHNRPDSDWTVGPQLVGAHFTEAAKSVQGQLQDPKSNEAGLLVNAILDKLRVAEAAQRHGHHHHHQQQQQPLPAEQPGGLVHTPTTLMNLQTVLLAAVQGDSALLLEGPTGAGKSAIIKEASRHFYGAGADRGLIRFNLSSRTTIADLIGSISLVHRDGAEQLEFRPGPFTQAFKDGRWILLDEMNLAPDEVLQRIELSLDLRELVYVCARVCACAPARACL